TPWPLAHGPIANARVITVNLLLAAAYAAVGIATLLLGETGGVELRRVIWCSSGIAAVVGLMAPYPVWWGVALGGAVATGFTGGGVVMILATGIANALEVHLLVSLLRRVGLDARLGRVRDVLLLLGLGSGVAAGLAAIISVSALGAVAGFPPDGGLRLFVLWWLTHAMGILVITPVGLTLASGEGVPRGSRLEATLVLAGVAGAAYLPFLVTSGTSPFSRLLFLPLPLMQWAALRLGGFGAALSGFIAAAMAMAAAVLSTGPLAVDTPTVTLVLTWLYANVAIVPTLITSALVTTARRASEEQRAMQARLVQSEKMESLGVLAGGIAHDFNNLLAAIRARAELIGEVPNLPEDVTEDSTGIIRTADEAAALCRQMLTYAGRSGMAASTIDLSSSARDMQELLKATTQRRVSVLLDLANEPLWINADASQVRQVVLNLVVNAAEAVDASKRQGRVFIKTRRAQLDAAWLGRTRTGWIAPPGEYAVLEVVDDGVGMDTPTLQQVFDPFYSSKGTGRGLGLSTVVGVTRSHHGALVVESHPGSGTTFTVAFPLVASPIPTDSARPGESRGLAGRTVLVVDDDEAVRTLVVRMLRKREVNVLQAADGDAALAMVEGGVPGGIDLILLDMTMPGRSG
ncbi:MAG: MASE1 domain-containing protein, partial [Gemmatimonadetes bacterium]|nr:MASE1 domain-containing protein [Gemmatimonadota bacterium]